MVSQLVGWLGVVVGRLAGLWLGNWSVGQSLIVGWLAMWRGNRLVYRLVSKLVCWLGLVASWLARSQTR